MADTTELDELRRTRANTLAALASLDKIIAAKEKAEKPKQKKDTSDLVAGIRAKNYQKYGNTPVRS